MPFGTTVGGTALAKAYVGDTPVKRIYTGSTHVWPPLSAKVTWIGSTVGTGTTNTYPAHTAGDLLVALVVGTNVAPSGYTVAATSTAGTTVIVAYRWATGANTAFGTFTGAQASTAYVFRNADTTTPFGAIQFASGSGVAATAPALTLTDPSGASAVAHTFYNAASAGAWVNKVPPNFLGKNQQARMANNQMIDTVTATTEASTMTHTVSSLWSAAAIEVLAPQTTPPPTLVPTTQIEWVGANSVAAASGNFPVHQAGDLLVVAAVSTTATPRVPPSGYTTAYTSPSGFGGLTVAYRWATAPGTTMGTWPSGTGWLTGYAFRGANTTTPLGVVDSVAVDAVSEGTTPQVTLTDTSGASLVTYMHFTGAAGTWGAVPAGCIQRNSNINMYSSQKADSTTDGATTMTRTGGSGTFRSLVFEVLAPVQRSGLYGVRVEYGDNYDVTFTALTSYAADPNEAFFFRSTPITNDGYTARTFTKTYRSSAVPMDCTLEEYWATPSGVRNTITFDITPRAVGGGVVEEIIPTALAEPAGEPALLPIKGSKTSKLYHTPDSPYYESTSSEVVFDTEEQAQAAGYTKWVKK